MKQGSSAAVPIVWRALAVLSVFAPGLFLSALPGHAQAEIPVLRSGAADGDAEAINSLGLAYAAGRGVPQDFARALSLYQQAADRGLAAAWFSLGMAHELGEGVPADPADAFKFYLKGAERGFPAAQFNAGNMYANGIGVKQDLNEAVLWFKQAGEAGVPEAQFNLGLAYELGRGVRQDEGLAMRWYRRASQKGNARGQYNLALMMEEGRGAPADPSGAMELYRLSAAQNFGPAQNNLGILLAEGRGTAVNFVEAFAWLSVAADNGVASDVLALVAGQLSPAGKTEAQAALALLRVRLGGKERASTAPEVAATAPAPQAAPAADAPAGIAARIESMKARMALSAAELERVRADNARLLADARAAEITRADLERRLAGAESAARSAVLTTSAVEAADSTLVASNLDIEKLAGLYPRVAGLVAENARLNREMNQSALETTNLGAQLRLLRRQAAATATAASPPAPAENTAELTRRIALLRRTIDRLAEESRQNADRVFEIVRLQQENDRLRSAQVAVP